MGIRASTYFSTGNSENPRCREERKRLLARLEYCLEPILFLMRRNCTPQTGFPASFFVHAIVFWDQCNSTKLLGDPAAVQLPMLENPCWE